MPALSRQRSVVCLVGPSLLAALVAGLPLSERRDSSFLGSRRTTGDEAERGPFWVPCFNFPRVAPSGEEDHVLGTFHPSKIHHGSDGGAQSGFSLRVSPTRLGAAGGDVSVQWNAPALHAPLWIGAFLANDNITETAPLKFALITRFARGNALRFSLPNMRDDFVFALFEGGVTRVSEASGQPNSRIHAKDWEDSDVLLNGGPATLVATSPLVRVAGRHQPTGVHIALTGVAGEMLVSWTTGNAAPRQVVQIRRQGGEIEEVAVDPATSYNRADMCGPPATSAGFRPPGHLQHARIVGIPAAAMVTYRVGSDAGGWSPWRDFRAPPANGAVTHALQPEGVSFVAFGDLGQFSADDATQLCQCPASRRTTDGILASVAATDFVLHVGDISYARGYASEWDFFMQQIEPIAARIPWMTSIGNHERDWPASGSVVGLTDSGGECGVAYRARFPMPPPTNTSGEPQGPKFRRVSRGAASDDSPWYSFDWGPVHILVYSTEHAIQAQLPFMRSDLARVDRTATPWIIVAGHRPLYLTGLDPSWDKDQKVATELRGALEELFFEEAVDVVLAGHHHSYQRTCPIYKGDCKQAGTAPVYFVVGMAGFIPSPIVLPARKEFSFVDSMHHGFVRIEANRTSLSVAYIRNAHPAEPADFIRIEKM